jgi:phospholipid/cholesterol/gamma-HCH transport system permease protein
VSAPAAASRGRGLPPPAAAPSRPNLLVRLFARVAFVLAEVGRGGYYLLDIARGLREPGTWGRETVRQMYSIGVGSIPLVIVVAGFLGGVTAFQTFYQLFAGVQYSVVGLISRQSIVLELGPLLTALTLTGRVGARMTAEIGTMRVTEQIDALETLAYDPIAYLSVPRVLASLVMLPVLVLLADATAIVSAWIILVVATPVTSADYEAGLRLAFTPFQIVYSLIKAFAYGGAISTVCSYQGYVAEAGAEGVGRSTAKAVVITSITILVLDGIIAAMFATLIQA